MSDLRTAVENLSNLIRYAIELSRS